MNMKYILLSAILLTIAGSAFTQQSPAEEVAARIAGRMKDSLELTITVRDQLYNVNLQLHDRKMAARQQYTEPEALRQSIQQIENTRDSLYRIVLQDENKYFLYKQKKRNLIGN
ncbi:MAG: hypothetical protein BGO52_02405 [Sphingobacteriales bacterium 44-61]|nr:MAG: hypothetical protein BGO52_02405 [Sphingobacteriales bacterium 44-61]